MKRYTRKEKRKLTLAKAKKIAKERGLDRLVMHRICQDLRRSWPKGTIEE